MKLKEFEVTIRLRNNLLKERRDKLGFSQSEMALAIGIPTPQYATLECLSRSPMRNGGEWSKFALKIAEYFDCDPIELFPESITKIAVSTASRKFDGAELPLLVSSYNQKASSGSEQHLIEASESVDEQYILRKSLSKLRPIEVDILRSSFGGKTKNPMTIAEIAQHHGLSKERIRQIKETAYGKVRRSFFSRVSGEETFSVLLTLPKKSGNFGHYELEETRHLIDMIIASLKKLRKEAKVYVVVKNEVVNEVSVKVSGFVGEGCEHLEREADRLVRGLRSSTSWRKQ